MKGTNLGEFEELILLTIAGLSSKAYSVAIVDELDKIIKRKAKLGVVQCCPKPPGKKWICCQYAGRINLRERRKTKAFLPVDNKW